MNRSDDPEKAEDSIWTKREFNSNETERIDSQAAKHDEPMTRISEGMCRSDEFPKGRINLRPAKSTRKSSTTTNVSFPDSTVIDSNGAWTNAKLSINRTLRGMSNDLNEE
jgi:hypothetical protein